MFRLPRSLDGQRSAYSNNLNSVWPLKNANYFLVSFSGKIDNLLSGLQCFNNIDRASDERRCFTDCIDVFDRTTNTEITAICSATKKTCVLYPLLANQLTDNITRIVPAITRVTNTSLDEGVMPKSLKHAIVRPLLKKPSLDKDTLSSYRPVSNLTQLSKVIEKVVALRIMMHVSDQQMVECFQSAYRGKNIRQKLRCYMLQVPSKQQWTKNKEPSCFSLISVPTSIRSTITSLLGCPF